MKVWIDYDEVYPVFDVTKEAKFAWGKKVEVDEATYERWIKVLGEHARVQKELLSLHGDI